MQPIKIITTGISGSGSKGFCLSYAEKRGKTKVYNTGDMIEELVQDPTRPKVPYENVLNLNPQRLGDLREKVFNTLLYDMEKNSENYERFVIDTHAQFYWNNVFYNAYDWRFLNKIPAEMFITIIDRPSAIQENQRKTDQGASQNHDLKEILQWQNIEVNVTKGWANNYGKPMYVLPRKQNPEIIESLLDSEFLVYFSIPMTDADDDANEEISVFHGRLFNLGIKINKRPTPIIDPRTIDLESEKGLSLRIREVNEDQTVHRDLDGYIPEVTHVVAYYPRKTNISLGVSQEVIRAYEDGKSVYVVCPDRKRMSPFMRKSNRIFQDEDEFFGFFYEEMKKKIDFFKRKR